jgi:predicted CoA-binding protein
MTTPLFDPDLIDLATNPGVVAVAGFTPKPDRPVYGVAAYLIRAGVTVYLVNPTHAGQSALGLTILPALAAVPEPIHIVDIFRRSEMIAPIIDDAIAARADAIWLQLAISDPVAEAKARAAGLRVIVNRCLKVEHARLTRGG